MLVRSRWNRAERWGWLWSAAWSRWRCRVSLNWMLVWKKVQVSHMASKGAVEFGWSGAVAVAEQAVVFSA